MVALQLNGTAGYRAMSDRKIVFLTLCRQDNYLTYKLNQIYVNLKKISNTSINKKTWETKCYLRYRLYFLLYFQVLSSENYLIRKYFACNNPMHQPITSKSYTEHAAFFQKTTLHPCTRHKTNIMPHIYYLWAPISSLPDQGQN